MHRKPKDDMLPLDIEIKRTLRNLRKVTSAESTSMANQREILQPVPQEVEIERHQRQMTKEDFWRLVIQDEYSTVRQPTIEANNFELQPALITMVQQYQFTGHPSEDPNEHMGRIMRMANTIKLNRVRPKVTKLQLFLFSLRDVTATWFESLPVGSVTNWGELVEAYMSRFSPLALTFDRRGEIIVFKQGDDESLYNAWERYKRLLKRCPMHGIDLTTQMDIFYHSMNYASKGIIHVACYRAFKRRIAEEARQLIEDLAKCNYKAPSESSVSSNRLKGSGVIVLNWMTAIEAKLDALLNKLGNNERRMHMTLEVGTVDGEKRKSVDEGLTHDGSYQVKQAQYLNANRSFTFKPNLNLPTHYTPALRSHENFSYRGGAQQGQRSGRNLQQYHASPRFQQQQ